MHISHSYKMRMFVLECMYAYLYKMAQKSKPLSRIIIKSY